MTDRFQRDVGLVLRLFSLFEDWEKYETPMKEYLNKSMRQNIQFILQRRGNFIRSSLKHALR